MRGWGVGEAGPSFGVDVGAEHVGAGPATIE
ncbi:unannotated protein [freshwater metagenome]|uniref:Unannotated protein n=1 Tax=freshwater metagenome TaxID=449393 RepID=A0A6J7RKW0_9ZZZZ